jgi:DNA-binding transcriptional ArsR family regulator
MDVNLNVGQGYLSLITPKCPKTFKSNMKTLIILMVSVLNVNWQNLPADYSLSERDADVLALIETEDLVTFTFDGLKRRTGLHPETLSRILSRLEQEGIIKKGLEGYRVTPKITELKLSSPKKETPTTTLIQTYLPSDLITQRLILNLKGKWFGSLRWFGISENSQGIILKWLTEDGAIQIAANIQGTSLNIEAKFLTNNNIDLALKASYQLMSLIGKICISSQTASHAMARTVGYYGGFSLA